MNWLKGLLGYTVTCKHAGMITRHYCWTRREAVRIMRGYPIEWFVWIDHSMGIYFVAGRFLSEER